MRGQDGTSGVDWDQVTKVGEALLFSPLFGFFLSALLLLLMKAIVRVPALYKAPEGRNPPPPWIRGLLVLTCTLVSFFHGSNDGQKGMGLIMLILIGVAPTAYALNRAPPAGHADVLHRRCAERLEDRRSARRRLQYHRRSAPCGDRLCPRPQDLGGHLSLARRAGAADQRLGQAVRLRRQDAAREGAERPQRHVSGLGGDARPRQGQGERADRRREEADRRVQEAARLRRPSSSRSG